MQNALKSNTEDKPLDRVQRISSANYHVLAAIGILTKAGDCQEQVSALSKVIDWMHGELSTLGVFEK